MSVTPIRDDVFVCCRDDADCIGPCRSHPWWDILPRMSSVDAREHTPRVRYHRLPVVFALWLIVYAIFLLMLLATAHAAPPAGVDPNSPLARWFQSLKVPNDTPPKMSCCGVADGYKIRIVEDALCDANPKCDGIAEITDGSEITFADGRKRVPLPNGTRFHFDKSSVNPLADGNPTNTAWAFLLVTEGPTPADNRIARIYCIIPVPPAS